MKEEISKLKTTIQNLTIQDLIDGEVIEDLTKIKGLIEDLFNIIKIDKKPLLLKGGLFEI
jgi:hypothetical protein